PPVGFTGSDTFHYTLASNGQTRQATVTVTVSGKVWFIKTGAGACSSNCDGRLTNPFTDTGGAGATTFQTNNTGAAGKPAANDPVFIYASATSYAGAVTLLTGQRLIGEGASGTLASLASVTVQNGQTLPATGGTAPTLASALTVGSGNFLHGM